VDISHDFGFPQQTITKDAFGKNKRRLILNRRSIANHRCYSSDNSHRFSSDVGCCTVDRDRLLPNTAAANTTCSTTSSSTANTNARLKAQIYFRFFTAKVGVVMFTIFLPYESARRDFLIPSTMRRISLFLQRGFYLP
jgi:hypothetical protein